MHLINEIVLDHAYGENTVTGLEEYVSSASFRVRLSSYFEDVGTTPLRLACSMSIRELKEFIEDLNDFASKKNLKVIITDDF